MSRPFWLRPLRIAERGGSESVAKAAAHNEPLEAVLRTSAASLLEGMNADRAGVWLEHGSGDPVWHGQVAQIESLGTNTEACSVNAFEVFPVEFNDAQFPLEFFAPVFPAGPREFFEGISTAVGVPLRFGERILGAALAASVRPGKMAGRETFENITSEIALALYSIRIREEQERASQELHLREEIDDLLARGAATNKVLRRILWVAMHHTGAQFAGVACRLESSLKWEAIAGAEPAEHFNQALFGIATSVFLEREPIIRDLPNDLTARFSVVGLPLDLAQDESLALLASFRFGDRIPLDRLEVFCAMAANARAVSNAREADYAYRSLFESSEEALVIVDKDGTLLETNRRGREVLQWRNGPELRIGIAEFCSTPIRDELELWFKQAAETGRVPPVEAKLGNGLKVRLLLRRALPGSERLLVTVQESSIMERAERHWKQAVAELRSVIDSVPCGVVLISLDGQIRFINSQFGALFGLNQASVQALKTVEDLAAALTSRFPVGSSFSQIWRSFVVGSDDAIREETEITTPESRFLERYARPVLNEQGQRLGWLEVFWDVTAQRQMQSKLPQTEKMAAVGQLASGIAHELNNPLTSIMGYAQLLLRQGPSRMRVEEARMIFDEAERARRMVKNLLSFAHPAPQERTRTDLNEVIRRTIELREYELKLRNIEVRLVLELDLPPTLADPNQLQQVVLNLVMNAEQAVVANGEHGVIEVRTKTASADRLSLEVCDNGPGIPRQISSRIFDLFFTTKAPGEGTGLGLAIVRSIVERHGGEVRFENIPLGGAKFAIELPLLGAPALETPEPRASLPAKKQKHKPARILIVEDEPTVARLVQDVLRNEGHEIEAVLDSQEGLRRVSRSRYDLVICDLRMPGLDGPAFYDALVRAGNTARGRILFITGDMLGPHTTEFLQARQLPFLAKPFLVDELKTAVYRALEQAADKESAKLANAEAHG